MPEQPPTSLECARLRLQAARPEHATSLFQEYTGRAEAARYLQRGPHPSQARTEAVIDAMGEANWSRSHRFAWSILRRSDEKAIGLFLMFLDGDKAEIHYGIGSSYWGQGYATEAGLSVMRWIVEQSSLAEVSTCCATEHAASLRVLEKLGLRRVELLADKLMLGGSDVRADAWLYRWQRPLR